MGTGGTPMGGAGGTGGAPVLCNTLSPEAVATIDAAWQHDEYDPQLVLSANDTSRATLLFSWLPLDQDTRLPPLHPKIGHIDFQPWGAWSNSLGQAWVATNYGTAVNRPALGDSVAIGAHSFLLYDDGSFLGPEGMAFVPAAVPKEPIARQELGGVGQRPLFVTRHPDSNPVWKLLPKRCSLAACASWERSRSHCRAVVRSDRVATTSA